MSRGRVKRTMPVLYRDKIQNGEWAVGDHTRNGHVWLVHLPTGRRVSAPGSISCYRGERNLISKMSRFERGLLVASHNQNPPPVEGSENG